jgi:hypothetical protein
MIGGNMPGLLDEFIGFRCGILSQILRANYSINCEAATFSAKTI